MEFELIEDLPAELAEGEHDDDDGGLALDRDHTESSDRPLWDWHDSSVEDQAIHIPEQEDG